MRKGLALLSALLIGFLSAAEISSLPGDCYSIEQMVSTYSGIHYALCREKGFLVSFDNRRSWIERNRGLPRKVVHPFNPAGGPVRHLTSLGIDPMNEGRIAVTTANEIFLSEDYGHTWENIPLGKPLSSSSYLTAVALCPVEKDAILLGTSFNGFFETRDRGLSWQKPSFSAHFLYRGAGFYEEISGVSYHPEDSDIIIFSCGFGYGIYISAKDRKSWSKLDFPDVPAGYPPLRLVKRLQIKKGKDQHGWLLEAQTADCLIYYNLHTQKWQAGEFFEPPSTTIDPFRRERIRKASARFGIYISSHNAGGEELENHLQFLSRHGLNSIVVDFKDDFGWVTYNTRLKDPYRIGAVTLRIDLEQLLTTAHKRGVYVIGRLVVFKDRQLFNYADYKYAAWNGQTDGPWRYLVEYEDEETGQTRLSQNEYWVDPFNPDIWKYNIAIAEELEQRGVDEIQFDYIRFPSDGDLSKIRYRYRREGMSRIDALESFLSLVRESIHIPISTDLYGFNSWHRMGNWIGQNIDMLADFVDVICPMFYPSHFPGEFINDLNYLSRARQIYQEGTTRAASIVGSRSIIRPYVQAFLIGSELEMSSEEYSSYLTHQIEGTLEAPSSGLTLWNASNRYYMVRKSLKPYFSKDSQAPRSTE